MQIHDPRIPAAEAGGVSTVHWDDLGQKQGINEYNFTAFVAVYTAPLLFRNVLQYMEDRQEGGVRH